jgi:hypothetical protein
MSEIKLAIDTGSFLAATLQHSDPIYEVLASPVTS